ncbi:MAG: hypothetical protein QXF45_07600 [Candidatus Caldarchaeum sp.]
MIKVFNARIVEVDVLDEGGGPPPISAVFSSYRDIVRSTVNADGFMRFTLIREPSRVLVGSPLRKTAVVDVPSGGYQSLTVSLKRAVSLSYEVSGRQVSAVIKWDNVELHDIGSG